ncbi:MAG: endolytic transglycosylase MltG [Candidatus Dormibacteria bacterium]
MRYAVAFGAFILVVLLAGLGGYSYYDHQLHDSLRRGQPAAMVEVPPGTSVSGVADILHREGVIGSTLIFELYVRLGGHAGRIQAGRYSIPAGYSMVDVVVLLEHNNVGSKEVHITIPEGYTTRQAGAVAERAGLFTADAYVNEAAHGSFTEAFLGDRAAGADLQGYLFPDTYFVDPHISVHDFIDLQLRHFGDKVPAEKRQEAAARKLTFAQAVTLASIIEREARYPEDRPQIAAVFYNRLEQGIPLQADATLLFARGLTAGSITDEDKKINSPYNTYAHAGLPPGAICNPGLASLLAALEPGQNNFLYYITDASGHAHFARTLAEHQQNIVRYGVH